MVAAESNEVTAELASIAYEHAIRGLDSQSAVLAEARVRANYVIVATVAVAALFAGLLLNGSPVVSREIAIATVAPLAVLALGMRCVVQVLRPTGKKRQPGELQFVASATEILALTPATSSRARADVAKELEGMWDGNQCVIEGLLNRLRSATTWLAGQVACWTILLGLKQVL